MKNIITDGNNATAMIAYKLSQVVPVYPITPSTSMCEYCSKQSSKNIKNIWNEDVKVVEMQSEAGVAGALHGSLLGGAISSTFTCSQGLLLMIPNMFKIAAENLPAVIHCSSRTIGTHALSIFCDHTDVMATRTTGFCMIASSSVQECHDTALISHIAALKSSMPILHFFDGFRTSHETQKIKEISNQTIQNMMPSTENLKVKKDALCPNNPKVFGTIQNPDVFFQNKEKINNSYKNFETELENTFKIFEEETGRKYSFFEYFGSKTATNLIVAIGSSTQTLKETLTTNKIKDTALLTVKVFRPFNIDKFVKSLPKSIKKICVLDRTKEVGDAPLFLDVSNAILSSKLDILVLSGIYGIGGKDFTPASVMAVINNLNSAKPKQKFTVGINDDENFLSVDTKDFINPINQTQIKIFGLGSDGSISASKSCVKIIGNNTNNFVQGFYEYDSKKAGSMTISNIRISNQEIQSTYPISNADIISINNFGFIHKYDCLKYINNNGTLILNSIFNKDEIDKILPNEFKAILKEKNIKLYLINAYKIAKEYNLNEKINNIMQMAFFKISKILAQDVALNQIENEIKNNLISKGEDVVKNNIDAIVQAVSLIEEVDVKKLTVEKTKLNTTKTTGFMEIVNKIKSQEGNSLPVSAFSQDGSTPTNTTQFEKRDIATTLPEWNNGNCLQCGMCVMACPHGALKAILVDENNIEIKQDFAQAIGKKDARYRIQLSPKDCTGCGVCANVCPAIKKALLMVDKQKIYNKEVANFDKYNNTESLQDFSTDIPKGIQFMPSYFNFSGACAGCGETPYIKLASTLFAERMTIANASGCSSVYCGTYPSCPFSTNSKGKGVAWANSLFEDNAEFGFGISLAKDFSKSPNKSVWIVGGDGWACDIGFGGLDHVLQSNEDVNILVLDNENYANTGGQASKSTQTAAMAKFCENGKELRKKDLGLIAMSYNNCYVASVSMGANFNQCIKAFKEAEAFKGPSLIIAYSPCVEHGYDMSQTMQRMKEAVSSGYVNLYRYHPQDGLTLDFDKTSTTKDFLKNEKRFNKNTNKDLQDELFEKNSVQAQYRLELLKHLSNFKK